MNIIAILNHMGVYFKEEPIRELHKALEAQNFQIVYPNDREDLLKRPCTRFCVNAFSQ